MKEQRGLTSRRTSLQRTSGRIRNRVSTSMDELTTSELQRSSTTAGGVRYHTQLSSQPDLNGSSVDKEQQGSPTSLNGVSSNESLLSSPKLSSSPCVMGSSPKTSHSPQPLRRAPKEGGIRQRRSFTMSWFQKRQSPKYVEPEEEMAVDLPPLILGDKGNSDVVSCFQMVREYCRATATAMGSHV